MHRVGDEPDERQVLVLTGRVGRQVRAALRHRFEGLVDERERVALVVGEDARVERPAARVADADAHRDAPDGSSRPTVQPKA